MCNIIYNFLVDSFWLISIRWLLTNLFAWNFGIFPHTVSFGKKIVDNGVNDIRIVGAVTLAVLIVICAIGMEWETKAQNFLIAIIVAAIFNFIIGAIMGPPSQDAAAQGFTGFNRKFRKTERRNLFTKKMIHNYFSKFFQSKSLTVIWDRIIGWARVLIRHFSACSLYSFLAVTKTTFSILFPKR